MRASLIVLGVAAVGAAVLPLRPAVAQQRVGERIAFTACPYAGVTAPCLMINGADGTTYNMTSASPKPPMGRMIRLRATVSDKASACNQGTMLDRIRWTPVRQKCPN